MFNIVICELKKFKRMWIPLIIGMFLLIEFCSIPLNPSIMKSADEVYTWLNMALFSYGFLIAINLLTAYVFIKEFNNNTIQTIVVYKYERWKLFIGKIITIIIVSFILYIVEFTMITSMSYISFKETLTLGIIMKHLILTIKAFVFQMLMITVTASLALSSKKIITTVIYIGTQLVASFLYLSLPTPVIRKTIPFPLPVVSNLMIIKDQHRIIQNIAVESSQVVIAIVMCIAGLAYGCWYMERMEVQ